MFQYQLAALRAERQAALALYRDLGGSEWETGSRASGWRVRDVVAHLGASCRILPNLSKIRLLRSDDVEAANEVQVDARRDWPASRILREYDRRSNLVLKVMRLHGSLDTFEVSFGNLGRYPLRFLPSFLMFEWHTHLRHDIVPALARPTPQTDFDRMYCVLEWMMAGLEQMNTATMGWLDRTIDLKLTAPAGGFWKVSPAGGGRLTVVSGTLGPTAAASITGRSIDFPAWATGRENWREHDLSITGDSDYAVRFLDSIKII
ncbi:maleylpyruvate isomerase N-terminal domain-containing protein [Streptomyces sp. NBC_00287]|uniref:maleylpyruvate isomerase N-terminal domain-containing protein n=1 Tax=Streptomyces sp. NBC_00287 TaxID=2975702 RepID=UPI002E2B35D4|nr:maleylpyruvate isomerase N-terminal domain-containing protein [Streptomyces sp. NBC_00287]